MRPALWIDSGVGVGADGNCHRISWQPAAPEAPPEPLAGSAIAVTLWPLPDGVGAAFHRGGWIRRCGSGALAAAAALHRWTGSDAGILHSTEETLAWRHRGRGRYCVISHPLPLQPERPPAAVARLAPAADAWYGAGGANDYWLARLPHRDALVRLRVAGPAWSAATARALVAVAPGAGAERYYLRYFAPQYGTAEDALTGSAHCLAAALWPVERACGRQLSPAGGVAWVRRLRKGVELSACCRLRESLD